MIFKRVKPTVEGGAPAESPGPVEDRLAEPVHTAKHAIQFPSDKSDATERTDQRSVRIPVNIATESLRSEMKEILLFASWDRGNTYRNVARITPDKNEFSFHAQRDGTCWLKVAVINREGKQNPVDITKGEPDLKLLIDTSKEPALRIREPIDGGGQGIPIGLYDQLKSGYLDLKKANCEIWAKEVKDGRLIRPVIMHRDNEGRNERIEMAEEGELKVDWAKGNLIIVLSNVVIISRDGGVRTVAAGSTWPIPLASIDGRGSRNAHAAVSLVTGGRSGGALIFVVFRTRLSSLRGQSCHG